ASRAELPWGRRREAKSSAAVLRCRVSRAGLVLPVYPVHGVAIEIAIDGAADGRKEARFAELRQEAESLELVLHRVLEFGEAQLDVDLAERLIQLGEGVGGGHVDAGDRFCRNDEPARRRRRARDRVQSPLLEELRVGEEQRSVPAKEHQAGDLACTGIA